jgi:hypothetical protein
LLGELIIFTHARDIKDYQVDEVIRYPEGVAGGSSRGERIEIEATHTRVA